MKRSLWSLALICMFLLGVELAPKVAFAVRPRVAASGGGSSSGTVTAPATGAGVDTCTGAGCTVGPAGISTDGGFVAVTSTAGATYKLGTMGVGGALLLDGSTGAKLGYDSTTTITMNSATIALVGAVTSASSISSAVASGSVAIQTLTGAKTCLGTGGVTCLSSNGTTTTSDSPFSVTGALLASSIKSTSTYVWSTGTFALGASGKDLIFSTAPTVSSGFGSGASITANNGPSAFRIGVGTTSATTGVIGLPTAGVGWNCFCSDITTNSTGVFLCKQTASTTTSATIGNFSDVAVATAWTNSDVLVVSCFAY